MKTTFVMLLVTFLSASAFAGKPTVSGTKNAPSSTAACKLCPELELIVSETVRESRKPKFDVDSLQLRATAVIQKMPDENKVVTPEQVRAIVKAFLASIPHDPARAIIENNIDLIKTNRAIFDAEIAKLPKEKGDDLKEAIAISLSIDAEGTDP